MTGKGVNIAIIDQPFDPNHIEYEGKIKEYEIYNTYPKGISVHGPAVTSIAVGENCGVAPDANVYYIGLSYKDKNGQADLKYIAETINHILEKNDHMENPIRAISISLGFMLGDNIEGIQEWYDAIERAKTIDIVWMDSPENFNRIRMK
ncbi:S8 family serine peptidase [Dubosiella newyorkensis]|uniref:S8 family serine peptidase n=1 Tax=Dubosiella newyorkensis TaxID=1862672 RepID=UPI0022B89181|nr:S8 family serine peptidase [Dubosiella newyorkensis]